MHERVEVSTASHRDRGRSNYRTPMDTPARHEAQLEAALGRVSALSSVPEAARRELAAAAELVSGLEEGAEVCRRDAPAALHVVLSGAVVVYAPSSHRRYASTLLDAEPSLLDSVAGTPPGEAEAVRAAAPRESFDSDAGASSDARDGGSSWDTASLGEDEDLPPDTPTLAAGTPFGSPASSAFWRPETPQSPGAGSRADLLSLLAAKVPGGRPIRLVSANSHFGESALLLGGAKQGYSAAAAGPGTATVAIISGDAIRRVLGLEGHERALRAQLLESVDFLREADAAILEDVREELELVRVRAKQDVVRIGDVGNRMFLVAEGNLEAFQPSGEIRTSMVKVNAFGPGGVFGEISMFTDIRRNATVTAVTDCVLYVLRQRAYTSLVERHPELSTMIRSTFLMKAHLFENVSWEARCRVLSMATERVLAEGETLFDEGDEPQGMYVVVAGSVVEERMGLPFGLYMAGKYFGHREAMNGAVHESTVTAQGDSIVLLLPTDTLRDLIDRGELTLREVLREGAAQKMPADAWSVQLEAHRHGYRFEVELAEQPTTGVSPIRHNCEVAVSSGFHAEPDLRLRESKTCQDRATVADDVIVDGDERTAFLGVYDGHGKQGHIVARFLETNVPVMLQDSQHFPGDLKQAFTAVFLDAEKALADLDGLDARISGSTATVVLLRRSLLTVAWVGDSRAVLASRDAKKNLVAVELTRDHKLTDPAEAARCTARGGVIAQEMPGRETLAVPDPTLPYRLWHAQVPRAGPGINMSRSIGDTFATMLGCIPRPDVHERELTTRDAFVIVASDGLWEVLDAEEACNFVVEYVLTHTERGGHLPGRGSRPKHLPVSCALAQRAQHLWYERYGTEEIIDDTTVLVCFLQDWHVLSADYVAEPQSVLYTTVK